MLSARGYLLGEGEATEGLVGHLLGGSEQDAAQRLVDGNDLPVLEHRRVATLDQQLGGALDEERSELRPICCALERPNQNAHRLALSIKLQNRQFLIPAHHSLIFQSASPFVKPRGVVRRDGLEGMSRIRHDALGIGSADFLDQNLQGRLCWRAH